MSARTNLHSLNYDVLEHIVSFLDSHDALSLCETSRWVHPVAKERALASVTVKYHETISRMSAYYLDDPMRLHLLRELDISCDFQEAMPDKAWDEGVVLPGYILRDYKAVKPLVGLLEQTKNLCVLKLNLAEKLLREEPRLGDAIASLSMLEELELTCVGSRCVELLHNARSTPRRLFLLDIVNATSCLSVLESLAAYQGLQELALVYGIPPSIPLDAMNCPRWPSVKKVYSHGIPTPLLEHAFPDATRLVWHKGTNLYVSPSPCRFYVESHECHAFLSLVPATLNKSIPSQSEVIHMLSFQMLFRTFSAYSRLLDPLYQFVGDILTLLNTSHP